MGKFKVGDRVRRHRGGTTGCFHVGYTGTVSHVDSDGDCFVMHDKTGGREFNLAQFLELVEQPAKWVPKVGDRVVEDKTAECVNDLVKHWNSFWRRGEGELTNNEFVVTKVTDNYAYYSNRPGGGGPMIEIKFIKPAALTIEAGKFYKTRDGRRVGPMEAGVWGRVFYDASHSITSQTWSEHGSFIPGLDSNLDLVAEWVDEPAIANDNAAPAKPKFKVGDLVKFSDSYGSSAYRGKKATVVKVSTWGIQVDIGGSGGVSTESPDSLVLVSTSAPAPTPTAIVALIENGVPKPAERPFVHATEAAGATEAARLARKHKGQQFGVYVLTTTSQEAAPTYEHEWQRLAAKGEKIPSIKALREQASLDLRSAKIAVETFVEKIAA